MVADLRNAIHRNDVETDHHMYGGKADALNNLRSHLDAGNPFIALVKYAPWQRATGQWYTGGHYVVVTGYDNTHITMHDPLMDKWSRNGSHFKMSHDLFCEGWGTCYQDTNPNWSCIVVKGGTAAPPPATTPVEQPGDADGSMEEINRRIRALAAYRRTAPPDFNSPAAVQFWRDHLGDWGLNYAQHLVQPGDTLSGLSKRYYGEAGRWYAIREYNDLPHDGLIFIGQTIVIPKAGTTGNQSALPQDTADFGKDLDLDDLVDPDLPAEDYNSFADAFMGIGSAE